MSDTAILRQRTLVMDEFMRLTKQEAKRLKPTASLEGVFLKRELTLVGKKLTVLFCPNKRAKPF
jgi:hypothetical protein